MKIIKDKPKLPEAFLIPEQEDFFIIGHPLKTKYGFVKPIKVKDYPRFLPSIEFLKLESWEVKNIVKEQVKGTIFEKQVYDDLSNFTLIQCIQTNVANLKTAYAEIFKELFPWEYDENFFYNIECQSDFDSLREQILKFNRVEMREKSSNPELDKWFRKSAWMKSKNGKSIDFEAMYTCLCMYAKPHDINDYTLSQFYGAFKRLELFKMYDTTTLYKTVDSKDKVKVVEWYKSFKDKDEEAVFNSVEEMDNALKGKLR